MKMTLFMMLWASPDWLRLSRADRNRIAGAALADVTGAEVSLRHFDAEAFCARISDIVMLTAQSAETLYFAVERLRDTPLITEGYFRLVEIVPAFEDGFRRFEETRDVA